ncbi:MAG TPA: hypothetical protein VND96_07500 [Candidatus Micrarchaeaceae archaeon]|nr:hypothetical protein [Candidatus Micrarchaeaceae archaeon]
MPTAGGIASKYGERYEGRWTLLQLFRVLRGEADWIRVEVPGVDAAEFALGCGETEEFHQVKRQRAEGRWTISALAEVLTGFSTHLRNPAVRCTFVTTEPARELQEICDRAKRTESLAEFEGVVAESKEMVQAAAQIAGQLKSGSQSDLWPLLKRISVEVVSEAQLLRLLKAESRLLAAASPEAVIGFLGDLLEDNASKTLYAYDVWQQIGQQGWRQADLGRDPSTASAIEQQNLRFRKSLDDLTIVGTFFPPSEVATVLELLRDRNGPKAVLVSGSGGAGKSGVLREAFDRLKDEGWPMLALRADWMPPSRTSAQLVSDIRIPTSPAIVLAALPSDRDRLLILDQLDAVSSASGRRTDLLVALEELFDELADVDGVRVLMACRQFDLESDRRLRKLASDSRFTVESVPISRWDEARIRGVLDSLGVPVPSRPSLLKLLETPLHLALYADLATRRPELATSVASSAELFDAYWDFKEQAVREAVGQPVHWVEVLESVSGAIEEQRALWVPSDVVDRHRADALAMISAGVLRQNEGNISFFHEAFFDYVFARVFSQKHERLVGYLLSRDQDLFRRSQVRQVLDYFRSTRPERFRAQLNELLESPDIRFHLKVVAVELLGQISDPTPTEWSMLSELVENGTPEIRRRLLGLLRARAQWFLLAVDDGFILGWLKSGEPTRQDRIAEILFSQQRQCPSVVARVLRESAGRDEAWVNRLRFIVQGADLGLDRDFFEFVLDLIDEGVLDGLTAGIAVNADFWDLGYGLSERRPIWAAELSIHHLERQTARAKAIGEPNPFAAALGLLPESQQGPRILISAADGAPDVTASGLVPVMLTLSLDNLVDDDYHDAIWRYRFGSDLFTIREAVRTAAERALHKWAGTPSEQFGAIIEQIRSIKTSTADSLLLAAYAGVPPDAADQGVEILLEDSARRLKLGKSARDVIANVTPHCSDAACHELEATLLTFRSDYERANPTPGRSGEEQFRLLTAFATSRLSQGGRNRRAELERKFGPHTEPVEEAITTGSVQSPIPDQAAVHMSDKDWMRAMQKHRGPMSFDARQPLKGGAMELAHLFQAQFKGQPERFVSLAASLPDGLNKSYYLAALWGSTEVIDRVPMAMTWQVFRRYQDIADPEVEKYLVRLAERGFSGGVPDDVLTVVVRVATGATDPDHDAWLDADPYSGQRVFGGSPDTAAMNSTRGSGALALAAALRTDPALAEQLAHHLDSIASDPIIAVRAAAAHFVLPILDSNQGRAISLLERIVSGGPDELLGGRGMVACLDHILRRRPDVVVPLVRRMVASASEPVALAGGQLAAVAWLLRLEPTELWTSGETGARAGAIYVIARQARYLDFAERCTPHLMRAFSDPDMKIREAAAQAFWNLDAEQLERMEDICIGFLESASGDDQLGVLLHEMDRSRALMPRVIEAIGRTLLRDAGEKLTDIRFAEAGQAQTAAELIVRIYSTTEDRKEQSIYLDLLDELLKRGALGVENSLADFER